MRIKQCLCINCKQMIDDAEWYAARKCCAEIVNPIFNNKYYRLRAELKIICPHCGAITETAYERDVTAEEIIDKMFFHK